MAFPEDGSFGLSEHECYARPIVPPNAGSAPP